MDDQITRIIHNLLPTIIQEIKKHFPNEYAEKKDSGEDSEELTQELGEVIRLEHNERAQAIALPLFAATTDKKRQRSEFCKENDEDAGPQRSAIEFFCPISKELISHPVRTPNSDYTYDRDSVKDLHNLEDVQPDLRMRNMIEDWFSHYDLQPPFDFISNQDDLLAASKSMVDTKKGHYKVGGELWKVGSIYKILEFLGGGAYGQVCKAQDKHTRDFVAVKMVKDVMQSESVLKRTLQEVYIMRRLSHPNILSLLDVFLSSSEDKMDTTDLYIVSEFADRGSVMDLQGPLYRADVKNLMRQILQGLKYMHLCKVWHSDIQAGIILFLSPMIVKFCDFNVSRPMEEVTSNVNNETRYTSTYCAPEVILSHENYGSAIDIWGIGCVFWKLLKLSSPGKFRIQHLFQHQKQIRSNPSHPLRPTKSVLNSDGKDIVKKGQRKSKYLFAFPCLVAPISGGKMGELVHLDTKNLVLYVDFPKGRLKFFGTIIYPKNKYLTLNFPRGSGNVVCQDSFDSLVVFSDVWWIGTKEETQKKCN